MVMEIAMRVFEALVITIRISFYDYIIIEIYP
jgi:hypothetical protein